MARQDMQITPRQDEILTRAAMLFQERGFAGATMRELAEHVGMEASSLYNHFAGKHAILTAVCHAVANAYLTPLAEIEKSKTSYKQKIEELLRLHVRLAVQMGPAVSVAAQEFRNLPEPALGQFLSARRDYEMRFEALIKAGVEAGELHNSPPRVVLLTLLSAIRWIEHPPRQRPDLTTSQLEEAIVGLIINGLAANVNPELSLNTPS